jgi:hypothetical protein
MNISEHFTLEEMIFSQTAARRGIDSTPGDFEIVNLRQLCRSVLEPIRAHFGKPVRVSSGYRSLQLNRAIGGSKTSQHCYGQAADISIAGVDNLDLAKWIRDNLYFDQVIMEGTWVHVSFSSRDRRQALTAHFSKGRVTYTEGL